MEMSSWSIWEARWARFLNTFSFEILGRRLEGEAEFLVSDFLEKFPDSLDSLTLRRSSKTNISFLTLLGQIDIGFFEELQNVISRACGRSD